MRTLGRTVALAMALQDRERGERIAQLREERAHMTQQELAYAMGIALRTVQKWEAGFGIQAANKRALADALNATIEEIMGETEPVNPFSVVAEIDARVQEFRRYSDEMRAGFARVEAKIDTLAAALVDGGAIGPDAWARAREAAELLRAAHEGVVPQEPRKASRGRR